MRYMFRIRRTVAALLALAGCSIGLYAEAQSPTPANLFQPVDRAVTSVQLGPEVILGQPVQVDLNLLTSQCIGAMLNLNVIADEPLTGVVERVEHRSPMGFTVAGRLEEYQHGSFIIVVYEDVAVGVIRLPELNELYQLRYTSEGVHLIQRIDSSAYPPEQCYYGGGKPIDRLPHQPISAPRGASEPGPDRGGCAPLPPVYDVLMPYTHLARQAMGSTSAAIAQCQLAVEVGNEAYANSQINIHLRLVHTMEVVYDEPGDQGDWLDWVTADGLIGVIRNDYAADFVNMLTSGGTGIGWCGPDVNLAFSCARWDRAVNTWTLVHEMGHNQGCDHNREDAGEDCASSSYGYGHHFVGASGTEWGTVMSYIGTRLPNFSNPDVYHDGYPTGVPIGEEDSAHCAQVHNSWIFYCEPYRLTRFDVWVDFAHAGAEDGSFDLPYDTVAEGAANIVNGVGASEQPSLWIKAGSTGETISIDTPMFLRACGGLVTIGN